jgi:hypothetical protein
MTQARQVGCDLLQERKEVGVDEHGAVLGVGHHEGQFLGGEAHVEGVEDPTGAGHTEVGLEVAVAVPRQSGDACPRLQAEGVEGAHQLLGPPGEVPEPVAVHMAVGLAAHHLGPVVVPAGAVEE